MSQKAVWDAIAPGWSNWRSRPSKDISKFSSENGKILDVGCGNCRNLLPFSKAGNELYGIDFSKNMVEEAKKFCIRHKMAVKLKVADASKLPFRKDYFDFAMCLYTIHLMKEKGRKNAINELYRVLKPGKKALISVWYKKEQGEHCVPWNRKGIKLIRYYYFFGKKEFVEFVKSAGFEIINYKIISEDRRSTTTEKPEKNIFVVARKPL